MIWIGFGIMALGLLIVFMALLRSFTYTKKAEALKRAYDEALGSGDQKEALVAGIACYTRANKRELNDYDRQRIMEDLGAMI